MRRLVPIVFEMNDELFDAVVATLKKEGVTPEEFTGKEFTDGEPIHINLNDTEIQDVLGDDAETREDAIGGILSLFVYAKDKDYWLKTMGNNVK